MENPKPEEINNNSREWMCEDCDDYIWATWILYDKNDICDHIYCDQCANKRFGIDQNWRKQLETKGIVVPLDNPFVNKIPTQCKICQQSLAVAGHDDCCAKCWTERAISHP